MSSKVPAKLNRIDPHSGDRWPQPREVNSPPRIRGTHQPKTSRQPPVPVQTGPGRRKAHVNRSKLFPCDGINNPHIATSRHTLQPRSFSIATHLAHYRLRQDNFIGWPEAGDLPQIALCQGSQLAFNFLYCETARGGWMAGWLPPLP